MQVNSDFTLDNTPQVSIALKHLILTLAMNEVRHSGSFKKRKKRLKAYCENSAIDYNTLEYNLNLLFELLEDFRKTNDPELYRFLKLQAGFCFINELDLHLLQVIQTGKRIVGSHGAGSYGHKQYGPNSAPIRSGMVGGHLIGLD